MGLPNQSKQPPVQSSFRRNGSATCTLVAEFNQNKKTNMKTPTTDKRSAGKIGWALLWLMGIPIPILLLFFLMRGCT
jgi:hypothetical protein